MRAELEVRTQRVWPLVVDLLVSLRLWLCLPNPILLFPQAVSGLCLRLIMIAGSGRSVQSRGRCGSRAAETHTGALPSRTGAAGGWDDEQDVW